MRRAIVTISPELLCQLLHFPPDTTLHSAALNSVNGGLMLLVQHDDLREVPPGNLPPQIKPVYELRNAGALGEPIFVSWGQK